MRRAQTISRPITNDLRYNYITYTYRDLTSHYIMGCYTEQVLTFIELQGPRLGRRPRINPVIGPRHQGIRLGPSRRGQGPRLGRRPGRINPVIGPRHQGIGARLASARDLG